MNGCMIMTLKRLRRCTPRAALRALAVGVMTVALSTGAVACSHLKLPTPPVGLSDCYEGLPLAEGALNAPRGSYQFHGVKLVNPKVMERLVRGQVAFAPQNVSGKAAIVLVTTKEKLLFSFVLAKLPENFGRTFAGT
jgi:hypothetical protein